MVTSLSYIPKESIPTISTGNQMEFTEYSNRIEREQHAEPWIKRYRDIERREDKYREQAQNAWNIYHGVNNSDYNSQEVVLNLLKKTVDFYVSSLYPSYAKPVVDIRPTGNEQTDKVISEVADIKQLALENFMDNGAFDTPMMECLREALITGRGILRTYIYQDPKTNQQRISWKSIPYDRIYIPEADDWDSVSYIIQRHVITKDEASLYFDPSFQTHEATMPPTGTSQYDVLYNKTEDSYEILEVWEAPRGNQPCYHHFIRLHDKVTLSSRPDPYQIPNKGFPYSRPIIPSQQRGLLPVPLYESFRILHEALQLCFHKDIDSIRQAAVKFLSLVRTDGFEELIEEAQHGDVVIDDNLWTELKRLGIDDIRKALIEWPMDAAVAFITALTQKEEVLTSKIYEISGVADIQRGLTQEGETATAQRIKQFNNNLRIRSLWTQTRFAVQDNFQIACDLIHRHMGQNPSNLARLSGRMLDQNDPINKAVIYALKQPDIIMHRIDVTTESLEMIDNEIQDQKTTQAMAVMKQFMADLPLVGDEPTNLLAYYRTYYQIIRNISLSPTIEKPLLENLESRIDELTQQIEQEKQDPSIAEQRKQLQKQEAIQMDPKHQQIIASKEQMQNDNIQKQLDRELEREKLYLIDQNKLTIDQQNADTTKAKAEADAVVDAMNAESKRMEVIKEAWLAEQNLEIEREKLRKGINTQGASYEEISAS